MVITATVTALNSSAKPHGGVEFYAGFTRLGMAPLLGEGDTRTAAIEVANLAVGRHELTARFLGHPEFQPSASLPAGHVVNPAAAADDREAQR